MIRQQFLERVKVVILIIALLALGAMIAQLVSGVLAVDKLQPAATLEQTTTPSIPDLSGTVIRDDLESTAAMGTSDPPEPVGLADEWANRLLEQIRLLGEDSPPNLYDLGWWQASDINGILTVLGDDIIIGETPISVHQQQVIDILVPSAGDWNSLKTQASISWEGDALLLTVNSNGAASSDSRWLISRGTPALAIETLVRQVGLDGQIVIASYRDLPGNEDQLVVVLGPEDEPLLLSTPTPSESPTVPPMLNQTPTATSLPDEYLGSVIAGLIDPVIDAAPLFHPAAQARFSNSTPWTGELTWQESGAYVAEYAIPSVNLTELSLYTLKSDDSGGAVVGLLDVVADENGLRLPNEQLVFYGHSINETYYWLVQHAEIRGGRLVIAIESYGTTQAITIIGFEPFEDQPLR
ncbi:MAG: hypothetical protein JXJ17_18880 [Anaerolineae bacterium]|nr:hypothetical protein [Anaerolineae bacterium]